MAITATPAEQQADRARARARPAAPVELEGGVIHPGVDPRQHRFGVQLDAHSPAGDLAFMSLCLALLAGGAVRKRVRAGRTD